MIAVNKLNASERLLLHLADNSLIFSHRMAEWCGKAPELELEMGMANIGLDHLGQARLWLEALIEVLGKKGKVTTEDELAYLREPQDFTHLLLIEQPNGDFARTIAKLYFYTLFYHLLLNKIKLHSVDTSGSDKIVNIATKASLEVDYHLKFSRHWMKVLANGTEESQARLIKGIQYLWPLCGEFFHPTPFEESFFKEENPFTTIQKKWLDEVMSMLQPLIQLGLALGKNLSFHLPTGKMGHHGEPLSYLLNEFQSLHRQYQGVKW